MPASIFGNPAAVIQLNQALFGIAPGNGKYLNQLGQANAVGTIPFARQLGATVAATNEALAATVLANVGIVNATLQTALVQAFAAFPNDRGVVVLNLTNILTTLEGNSVYGAAAAQFNAQVATDFQYSTNSVNTQDSPVVVGSATLTANTDILTGNLFTAGLVFTPGGDDRINSLQDEDTLTGTGTNATLNATLGNANDNGGVVVAPTLNNIATVNVAFTGAGGGAGPVAILDLQDATGLVNLGITRINSGLGATPVGAVNIQTAGTNNLSISNVQVPANVVFDYADSALAAKDDSATLNLASVNLNSVTIDENSINTTGGANQGFNTLLVSTTGANQVNNLISGETSVLNLRATGGSLSLANLAGNLAVAGAANPGNAVAIGAGEFQALGAVSFNNGGGVLSAINGSTSTGALTIDITGYEAPRPNPQNSGITVTTTVTGGSGNDKIISAGGILDTGLVIDGGTGTNTLALYGNLLDTVPTNAIRPTITNIQNLEVRTQANATIIADVSAVGGLQNIFLRNETANGAASQLDLRELTQAQANAITINHSASRGNGINALGVDSTQVLLNLNDASGAADSATLNLRSDQNNNNRFNVVLDADGNALAATVANAGRAVGNAGVENITINDNDNESNAIELTKFAEHTGTITVNGGVAGQFLQLDATANAYRWDQSGNTLDGGTASAAITAVNGRPTNGSRSDVGAGAAERLVAATFDSSTYLGDVVIRVSDNAAAGSLGGQRITFGAGNDTVIFDQITPGALNVNTAGLTISDTVSGGAGTDILGIDGNGVAVTITASEWTNVSGFEVIRTIGNGVASNNARGAVNSYNLTLTNDLLTTNGAADGGVRRIVIVNDNDATNDVGAAGGTANDTGNLGQGGAGNITAATGVESGITIDARTLTASNSFEYRGEEGGSATADRFILADANINGAAIIDGGGASNNTSNTSVVGNVITPAVNANRDVDSVRNNDVLEVRNAATVSEGDLGNITNVSTLEFTNDTAVAQNSILVLSDNIVDRLVDAYQGSRVEANVGTATQVLQNQERLVVKAIDNTNVNGATTGLTIQAGSLTGRSGLDILLGRAPALNIATGGGNDSVVLLGNYNSGVYAQNAFGEAVNGLANNQAGQVVYTGTLALGGQTGIGNVTINDTLTTYGGVNLAGVTITGLDQAIIANSNITLSELQVNTIGVAFTNATADHVLTVVDDLNAPGATFNLSAITVAGASNVFVVTNGLGTAGVAAANVIVATAANLGTTGNDTITATGNAVVLAGLDGNDNLTGSAGADTIFGGTGNDVITGLAGNDSLTGGAGSDTFVFSATLALNGNDTITDFVGGAGNDVLDFFGATAAVFSTSTLAFFSDVVLTNTSQVVKYTGNSVLTTGGNVRNNDGGLTSVFQVTDGANAIVLAGDNTGSTSFNVYRVFDSNAAAAMITEAVELIGTVNIATGSYSALVAANVS